MNASTFAQLGLAEPLLRALESENYTEPTEIQRNAIPELLAGRDLLGIAQTGTGKTAAFALPIIQNIAEGRDASLNRKKAQGKRARVLVLLPTRELAVQVASRFDAYGRHYGLRCGVIVGGVSAHSQRRTLKIGVDVIVATPGRLLDHIRNRDVPLDAVTHLVLDEADRMLDMGFVRDVRSIIAALPKDRQNLLFSATMPKDVETLARDLLNDPVKVEVTPDAPTAERIEQFLVRLPRDRKRTALISLLDDPAWSRVIVFSRTKHGANRLATQLSDAGIPSDAIHGNKAQNARQAALGRFAKGKVRVLVATDIAARGIDIRDITHVVNFELPNEPETYVHRIGRTARAGTEGIAVSFCDSSENQYLKSIERLTGVKLTPMAVPGIESVPEPTEREEKSASRKSKPRREGGRDKTSFRKDKSDAPRQAREQDGEPRREKAGSRKENPRFARDDAREEKQVHGARRDGRDETRADDRRREKSDRPAKFRPERRERPEQRAEMRTERRPESRPESHYGENRKARNWDPLARETTEARGDGKPQRKKFQPEATQADRDGGYRKAPRPANDERPSKGGRRGNDAKFGDKTGGKPMRDDGAPKRSRDGNRDRSGAGAASGRVKWYDSQKGYGFIVPDDGGRDIFLHASAVQRSGINDPQEGLRVGYRLERRKQDGKMCAADLKVA